MTAWPSCARRRAMTAPMPRELGSFTKAADDLQLPRATATHTIQQMEKRLGVRLLHRTTRQVSPTLDGDAYYQRCVRLLADVEVAAAFRAAAHWRLLRALLRDGARDRHGRPAGRSRARGHRLR